MRRVRVTLVVGMLICLAFLPLALPTHTLFGAAHPQISGDENWDTRFGIQGANKQISALASIDGFIYAGGKFDLVGDVAAKRIARFDPASFTWASIGDITAASTTSGAVGALAANDDNLFVGGRFGNAGGIPARNIAQFDTLSSTWSQVGAGLNGVVTALAIDGDTVYAGGGFDRSGSKSLNRIGRWDGTKWYALGGGVSCREVCKRAQISAIATQGRKVYVGGYFDYAGSVRANNVAMWDGTKWHSLGAGQPGEVLALTIHENDLYVGGSSFPNRLARWDGSRWHKLNDSTGFHYGNWIYALHFGENGLYVGGGRGDDSPAQEGIARWDGSIFNAMGQGIAGYDLPPAFTSVLAIESIGQDISVAGQFETAGGNPSHFIGLWHEPAVK